MAQEKIKDMTEGAPLKLIIGFAVPMFLGLLFQQFYSMVDTIIVGKYLGVNALAAVGSTGSVNFMINGFCIGVCSGFAIPVAQKFGARDYSGLRRFVANAAWLSIGISIVLTAVVSVLCMNILVWMKTPEDIIQEAYSYIFIIFLGIPTTFLYNMTSGIIRSLGDSKTPVYFLLMASVLNIFLDLFMIIVMKLGPAGAAYATVISQGLSGALCFFFMRSKYQVLKMTREEMRANKRLMAVLCGMGFPMGFQYSITAIGNVILQSAVNSLGSMAVAAVTAGSRVSMFFCTPFDALGGTMATWAGQNVGAGKTDRVKEGVRYANLIGFVYSIAAFVILFFFGKQISLLFVDAGEAEILQQAWMYLVGNSVFYIPLVLVNVMRFAIQGMGYSTFAIIAGVCEMVGRSLVGFVLVPVFGYAAACIGSPVAWIFADFFLVPAFYHCVKKMKKQLGQQNGVDLMRGTWKKKWAAGCCISMVSVFLLLSGCQSRQPIETKESAESSAEITTKAEEETVQTETESSEKPAFRDAKVMAGGRIYVWVYDVDFSAAPQDYFQAGEVDSIAEGTMPEADWEAVGLKKGTAVYTREDGTSDTIFVESEGIWSAFIPYEDVASAYEYSKEPWVYQISQREDGFSVTLPDGSWQAEAQGDSGIDSFAGKGGRVDIIHMKKEDAQEIFPYIDTEEECRELILNTGVSGEFDLAGFEAGLADSDSDPEASYYFAEIVYTGEETDYRYELRYALYCGGYYWQVQVLMKDNTREEIEKAAGIVKSFTVPTCKSPSIVLRYEGI